MRMAHETCPYNWTLRPVDPELGAACPLLQANNKKMLREVKTLSGLHHQSVVRYFQAWIEGGAYETQSDEEDEDGEDGHDLEDEDEDEDEDEHAAGVPSLSGGAQPDRGEHSDAEWGAEEDSSWGSVEVCAGQHSARAKTDKANRVLQIAAAHMGAASPGSSATTLPSPSPDASNTASSSGSGAASAPEWGAPGPHASSGAPRARLGQVPETPPRKPRVQVRRFTALFRWPRVCWPRLVLPDS